MAQPSASKRWQPILHTFSDEYYFRHRPEEVAWHAEIMSRVSPTPPILVEFSNDIAEGLTVLMVYSAEGHTHVQTTAILAAFGLNVVDARIIPVSEKSYLNTYCLLDPDGEPLLEAALLDDIRRRITAALEEPAERMRVNRRTPRQVRVFSTPVRVTMMPEPANNLTVFELVAPDRPGLLFEVCQVLESTGVELRNARVATIGERAEDVFFVTDHENRPLDETGRLALKAALEEALTPSVARSAV